MDGKRSPNTSKKRAGQPVENGLAGGYGPNPPVEGSIDRLRQRNGELEEANQELRCISHYRSLLLARMSHELRTPLTAILGFSEILLEQEQLTETQRRFCQRIQDSGVQLQMSLSQLIDLSRLESGPKEPVLQEFSVLETLRDSCAAVARHAQRQEVKLVYDLAPGAQNILSDQLKLRQIIYNFLFWAISRSEGGQRVRLWAEVQGRSGLLVRIEDEGELIADVESVFEVEEGASRTNVNELGIMIARRLVQTMKGQVVLRPRDLAGLEVTIHIPAPG